MLTAAFLTPVAQVAQQYTRPRLRKWEQPFQPAGLKRTCRKTENLLERGGISAIAEPHKAARETISHGWRSPPANWREMVILKLFCIKINKPVKIGTGMVLMFLKTSFFPCFALYSQPISKELIFQLTERRSKGWRKAWEPCCRTTDDQGTWNLEKSGNRKDGSTLGCAVLPG